MTHMKTKPKKKGSPPLAAGTCSVTAPEAAKCDICDGSGTVRLLNIYGGPSNHYVTCPCMEPVHSDREPRLVRRCPFCGSVSVLSFGPAEWRCESCTHEWNGSANTALTDDGNRCARCNASLHETEKIHGCIMCAANSQALSQEGEAGTNDETTDL